MPAPRWPCFRSGFGNRMRRGGIEMLSALSRYRWPISIAGALLVAITVATGLSGRDTHGGKGAAPRRGGGPRRGAQAAIRRYGCGGCHTIPGIPGGDGQVGGPLAGIGQRVFVGGVGPHFPGELVQWIVKPQSFSPRSAMPATGISETEARDVATYLYSQR